MRAPFPYHGNKVAAAGLIEDLMGPVVNMVIPFAGGLGELLGRSRPAKVETVNDLDGHVVNVWRSMKYSPAETAALCDEPVHEATLHAAHDLLVERRGALLELVRSHPKAHDVELAAWWIWGKSAWLGGGWCASPGPRRPHLSNSCGQGVSVDHTTRKIPMLQGRDQGKGVHLTHRKIPTLGGQGARPHFGVGVVRRTNRQIPLLRGSDGTGVGYGAGINSSTHRHGLEARFAQLAERLRWVRVTCGDWRRVLTRSVTTSHGLTGVSLDPPYCHSVRSSGLYAEDSATVAGEVREWALEHGNDKDFRIVLAGKGDEHVDLEAEGWSRHEWRADGEVIWASPRCHVGGQLSLLGSR